MTELAAELLKRWNNGILRGAQRKLANELGVKETAVSGWFSGKVAVGERRIQELSAVFEATPEEIKEAFEITNKKLRGGKITEIEKEAPATDGIFHAGEVVFLKPPSDKLPQKLLIQIAPDGRAAFRGADMALTDTSKEAGKEDILLARLPDGKYTFGKLEGKTFLQAGGKKTPAGKVQILAPVAQLRINL